MEVQNRNFKAYANNENLESYSSQSEIERYREQRMKRYDSQICFIKKRTTSPSTKMVEIGSGSSVLLYGLDDVLEDFSAKAQQALR